MSTLVLQQLLSLRFRTSLEADRATVELMQNLGLSTKASVARLAIGRSLAHGRFADINIDSKGLEIPASVLFTQEDVPVWVGLIVTHSRVNGFPIASMDDFRAALRKHWHRGAMLLAEDWVDSGGNFDRFLETLIIRRADLPDVGPNTHAKKGPTKPQTEPVDASASLIKALADIGVTAEVKAYVHGPRVTRYKVFLPEINQFDKLKRGLERLAISLNLQKVIPSLSRSDEAKTVSLDVPRPSSSWSNVNFTQFQEWVSRKSVEKSTLTVYPGVDVTGQPFGFDLATAPHLLVGGTTGSGKSVCLHALILSLVSRFSSSALKLALIDPKQVEFSVYKGSPYLYLDEVATTAASARNMLTELVSEMDARYQTFAAAGVNNIVEARAKKLEMPYIVVFIEEFADLLFMDKDTEDHVVRIAQKARAAGIHLVLATQRPDAKTFSGLVRSNVPARIALTVQKSSESNIILDESGAEELLGMGDMLVKARPGGFAERVHGVHLERTDIEAVLKVAYRTK